MNDLNNLNDKVTEEERNFFQEIENIKSKYKIEEGDPLFAFLEIQIKILTEMRKTNDNTLLGKQAKDINKMFVNLKDEFQFLSIEKKRALNEEMTKFIDSVKKKTIDELNDFKTEVKNSELLILKEKKVITNINKFSIIINFSLILTIVLMFFLKV